MNGENAAWPRRVSMQWFSLQRLAVMLDFDASTLRAWWRRGEFGPPADGVAADYFFVRGDGKAADVRISARGLEHFLAHHTASPAPDVIVLARSPGEARRKLKAVMEQAG